ncbi:MAG: hypothetical protein ACK521_11180 [bacterium]
MIYIFVPFDFLHGLRLQLLGKSKLFSTFFQLIAKGIVFNLVLVDLVVQVAVFTLEALNRLYKLVFLVLLRGFYFFVFVVFYERFLVAINLIFVNEQK